jgi:hypothetical protein
MLKLQMYHIYIIYIMYIYIFAVPGFELRACTLSHSTVLIVMGFFFQDRVW